LEVINLTSTYLLLLRTQVEEQKNTLIKLQSMIGTMLEKEHYKNRDNWLAVFLLLLGSNIVRYDDFKGYTWHIPNISEGVNVSRQAVANWKTLGQAPRSFETRKKVLEYFLEEIPKAIAASDEILAEIE
ncbi:MAG: hypothetical protein OXR68_02540, partial [Alphaproteobacteria bacterium]|nr:hypothetical protein [Alphaproteobacteria bacterium]